MLIKKNKNMCKYNYFVGLDISKMTLDFSITNIDGVFLFHRKISNNKSAILNLLLDLKKDYNIDKTNSLFCAEYTGLYGNILEDALLKRNMSLWLERGAHIKHSLGLTRGKTDKLDSTRMSEFSYTFKHKAKLHKVICEDIQYLKLLMTERRRLVQLKKQLSVQVKELKKFVSKNMVLKTSSRSNKLASLLTEQQKDLEQQMLEIIRNNKDLGNCYKIMQSVEGIGFVSAVEILVTTENFTKIEEAKKYACYAGVAPFEHSSGTSVRGKNRVSQMANKNTKSILHLAALSVVSRPGELQVYNKRKVAEGKNKMSVLNAVRNKLIKRVFACVKQNKIFEKDYQYDLVES